MIYYRIYRLGKAGKEYGLGQHLTMTEARKAMDRFGADGIEEFRTVRDKDTRLFYRIFWCPDSPGGGPLIAGAERYYSQQEAESAKDRLGADGIEIFIPDPGTDR